ncbi:MAG: flagellar motor protein MotB [Acidobacteriota bacterium]
MARKKKHPEHVNAEAWLISYADFITLLFAFFVVMFAVSQVDSAKVGRFVESVQAATSTSGVLDGMTGSPIKFGSGAAAGDPYRISVLNTELPRLVRSRLMIEADEVPGNGEGPGEGPGGGHPKGEAGAGGRGLGEGEGEGKGEGEGGEPADEVPGGHPADLPEELLDLAIDEDLIGKIALRTEPRGAVISLLEVGFFDSGSARIRAEAWPLLDRVAARLRESGRPLRFEGHADNRPISTTLFPSNWELSSARALAVLHHFEGRLGFDGSRLSAGIFGEHAPVGDNDESSGRAKNRRVDVVLLSEAARRYEPMILESEPPSEDDGTSSPEGESQPAFELGIPNRTEEEAAGSSEEDQARVSQDTDTKSEPASTQQDSHHDDSAHHAHGH